jgi:hypothetical protein
MTSRGFVAARAETVAAFSVCPSAIRGGTRHLRMG